MSPEDPLRRINQTLRRYASPRVEELLPDVLSPKMQGREKSQKIYGRQGLNTFSASQVT